MDSKRPKITWDTPLSELMHSDENMAYIDLDEGELMHWKYIKRKKLPNGKWRYYYDKDSLKNDVKTATNKVKNSFESLFSKNKSSSKSASKTDKKGFVERLKSTASKIKETVTRAKKTVHKYIAKVPTKGGAYRYFYSDEAYAAYLNGKNAVDKALGKVGDRKLGTLISDSLKSAAKNFTSNLMNTGFGKAVYSLALPAFTALQVALQTPKSFDDVKKLKHDSTNDEHQKAVNPKYDPTKLDYSYNCSFCTATYDLRKRGYDVEAMPISTLEAPVIEDILSWYEGAVAVSESQVQKKLSDKEKYSGTANSMSERNEQRQRRVDALNNSLEEYGEGARGHLAMYWNQGSGHDIAWEIENGKVVYRDCQTNQILDISETLPYVKDYSFVRVDNCEPTEAVLRTVKNRD